MPGWGSGATDAAGYGLATDRYGEPVTRTTARAGARRVGLALVIAGPATLVIGISLLLITSVGHPNPTATPPVTATSPTNGGPTGTPTTGEPGTPPSGGTSDVLTAATAIITGLGTLGTGLGAVMMAWASRRGTASQPIIIAVPVQATPAESPHLRTGWVPAAPTVVWRFRAPPGWPQPPDGWRPPDGWQPDPSWPPAPAGWVFWEPVQVPHAP